MKRWVGEGSYDEIEREIRRLIGRGTTRGPVAGSQSTRRRGLRRPVNLLTPASRTRPTSAQSGASLARSRSKGDWHTDRQYVELRKGTGEIDLPFTAGEVNLVMQPGSSGTCGRNSAVLDGKPVGDARGMDVGADGVARFDRSGMIRLVAGAHAKRRHVLTLVLERRGTTRGMCSPSALVESKSCGGGADHSSGWLRPGLCAVAHWPIPLL